MKKIFLSAAIAALAAGGAFAQDALVLGFGTGASAASSSGVSGTVLGGQGSIGDGAAASASGVVMNLQSSGVAIGATTLGGSAAGSQTNATGFAVFGSAGISTGQAGQFSGVGGSFLNGSDASAFGFAGLGAVVTP